MPADWILYNPASSATQANPAMNPGGGMSPGVSSPPMRQGARANPFAMAMEHARVPRPVRPPFMHDFPFHRINWIPSAFLIGTFLGSITLVPLYIWMFGIDGFQVAMFVFFFVATGMSITFGYHRLFAHRTFQTTRLIRFLALVFGASTFENSVLDWVSDHRRHHKHTDHEEDPYDISRGLFYAHLGWMLFKLKPKPPMDNVQDLRRDPMIVWQAKYWLILALIVGFAIPGVLGFLYSGWSGALGGVLIAGLLRVVAVQHCTFCINSLCHYLGSQPYSKRCSARDSWIMALVTFGEGYHNYHHEFQHDYRNGVKPWQFDPTKWVIWTLYKLGLAWDLKQVPAAKIAAAQSARHSD
jgi:stearoyl-CoA desaturase (Delta-9 desaturase)